MKCKHCGSEITPGSRFCEECGMPAEEQNPGREETEVIPVHMDKASINNRICPGCGSLVEEHAYVCGKCGYRLDAQTYVYADDEVMYDEPKGNDTVKMILIGAGIGLIVLALIFGIIHFIGNDDDEGEAEEATEATTSQEVDEDYDDYDEDSSDYERGRSVDPNDYSSYNHLSEDALYQSDVPVFFPDSSERYLTNEDIYGMSDVQLQKAVNDIYARNGRIFKDPVFSNYYLEQDWYSPYSDNDADISPLMNEVEKKNVDFLKKAQD